MAEYVRVCKTVVLVLVIATLVECSNNATEEERIKDEIPKKLRFVEAVSGKAWLGNIYENGTFRTGNSLWDNILNKCTLQPSVSCLQKNVYSYLDESLDFGDVNVGGVCFKKNNVDMNKYSKEANIIYMTGEKNEERSFDEENEIPDDEEPETPLEEVTDALYGKGVNFLMTHDVKLALPDMMFDGATLRVSPRALTKTGALVHVELQPRTNDVGEGRIFFNKIKKYLRKKLVMAALAIILVVKLIALKLVFVLPVILGVATAKKMFMKLLLFIFPALRHIFKLCSWYHLDYHTTKHHEHHHTIYRPKPHHHHPPVYGPPVKHGHGAVYVKHQEPAHQPTFEHYPQDWELSGPGLGPEYISDIHRNAIANFKPQEADVNDINAWGLGLPPGASLNIGEYASGNTLHANVVAPSGNIANNGRPQGPLSNYRKPAHLNPAQAEIDALANAAKMALNAPPSPMRDEVLRVSTAKLSEANRVEKEATLVKQQQEILDAQDPDTKAADQFYGALIAKVDAILTSIGTSEGCRERAICELYKDPFKTSPYSNHVSNELSKDSSELVPPAGSKMALRYYNYVTAARGGQENKDCLALHPQCSKLWK